MAGLLRFVQAIRGRNWTCSRHRPAASALLTWPDTPVYIAGFNPASFIHLGSGTESPASLSLDCHFVSNKYTKRRGAKGIRTPDLLHAMQTRYQLRHSPLCTTLEQSLVKEARPAPQGHSLAPASI
jgi:hypothetical protein